LGSAIFRGRLSANSAHDSLAALMAVSIMVLGAIERFATSLTAAGLRSRLP
jgi:hypothetical protein